MKIQTLGSALFLSGVLAAGAMIVTRAEHGNIEYALSDSAQAERVSVMPTELPPIPASDALVTAAFGLEALQPETYDRDLVLDIIDAAPLDGAVKVALEEDLAQAEDGQIPLGLVLKDVRVALSVD